MRSILVFPLLARYLDAIDVCTWRMSVFYLCCNDSVEVNGNVCCVAAVVKDSVFALEC